MKSRVLFFRGNDKGSATILALFFLSLVILLYFPYAESINQRMHFEKKMLENLLIKITNDNSYYQNIYESIAHEIK